MTPTSSTQACAMPNRAPASALATMSPMSTKPPIAVRIPSATARNRFTGRHIPAPRHLPTIAFDLPALGHVTRMATLRALVLVCSLKKSPAPSRPELLGREVLTALADHDVDGEVIRVADHDVRFGVSTDEGDGDESPALRRKLLDAHILVMATPIWMGQPASVCKMVLE